MENITQYYYYIRTYNIDLTHKKKLNFFLKPAVKYVMFCEA